MIPVQPKPEPADFDQNVRQKGLADLRSRAIDLDQPVPVNFIWKAYWTACLDELYTTYGGNCAYAGIHFERIIGAASTDHYIAKKPQPRYAYEWTNYRLACRGMNTRKNDYDDVLDPFEIEDFWFQLELVSGHIHPNPALELTTLAQVQATIDRLNLDDAGWQELRARHYSDYIQGHYTADFLRMRSPFVHAEAQRQGLL